MRFVSSLALVAALMPTVCAASTTVAWSALDRNAQIACAKQIVFLAGRAKVTDVSGRISGIGGDGDKYYGLILKSTVAGFPEDWICLYDKQTHKAQAREIQRR